MHKKRDSFSPGLWRGAGPQPWRFILCRPRVTLSTCQPRYSLPHRLDSCHHDLMTNSKSIAGCFMRMALSGALALVVCWTTPCRAEDDSEFFEKRVRPVLVDRCVSCHSAAKGKTKGNLALDTREGWRKGGDSGPPIIPGKPQESLLVRAIRHEEEDGPQMPPEEAGGKLPEVQIAALVEWVRRGAFDPRVAEPRRGGKTARELREWWSFQPLKPVTPPTVANNAVRARNQIDQFILADLATSGLVISPQADRHALIRRVTYDLIGLPPSPAEVDAFLADDSPGTYESLVDRLLQSPHYGQRWGRHWLDLVRYADTAGENSDHPIPDAWRYRNWVIDAFNRDLPYDQFVREQVAGDLLHANDPADRFAAGIVGTDFLAIARRFDHDCDKHMHLTFEDTIDTLGKAFLGLSIACARCHDHKYDPISSQDYYALYGILNSTRFAFPGCEAKQQPRDLVPLLPAAEWAKTVEPYDRQLAALDTLLKQAGDAQAFLASEFKAAAAAAVQNLARGEIPDGGSASFEAAPAHSLNSIDVRVGQMIQLTVDPLKNYGADTTLIELEIAEIEGRERTWNLVQDVTGDFLAGNPHADRYGNSVAWLFLDGRGGPTLLPERVRDHSGKAGLNIWR